MSSLATCRGAHAISGTKFHKQVLRTCLANRVCASTSTSFICPSLLLSLSLALPPLPLPLFPLPPLPLPFPLFRRCFDINSWFSVAMVGFDRPEGALEGGPQAGVQEASSTEVEGRRRFRGGGRRGQTDFLTYNSPFKAKARMFLL